MPAGSILSAPPAWQEAERQRAAYARLWLGGGAVAFVAGMILLFAVRQGYEPARHVEPGVAGPTPPDALPPSLAGVLAARGRPSLEQAAAALLALAERGDLRVEESDHRVLGRRTYHLTRRTSGAGPARHEEAVLAAMFKGRDVSVTLAKARTRLVRRFGSFSQAVLADLDAAGLLDHNRQRSRRSYLRLMGIEFILALAAFAAWPFLMTAHGAWPLAIPAALAASAIVTLIAYATTTTPLTDEGVRRGRQWRAYRDYLKNASRDKSGTMPAVSLAYPVALGLASEWSKHLKTHPVDAPAWFHSSGGPSAYAAFIAAAGAGAHGNSPPHHAH